MASHNSTNTQAFIEQEIYSDFIIRALPDGQLPDSFTRDVSDFGSGTNLNIPVIGTATLQDVIVEVPMEYNPIDTGRVNLQITDYVGDAWSIEDVLRMDGTNIDALHQARAQESTRALNDHFETRFLETANAAQTDANPNSINGFAHRMASTEADGVAALDYFRKFKLSFDKAHAPQEGRVMFVDPVVEATLNGMYNTTWVSNNPMFEGIITEGFARSHKFVKNIFGWDIYTTNKLATGDFSDGTTAITGAVANIAMCVSGDQNKPIMRAWRMQPRVESGRNRQLKRDEFDVRARFGLGAQRVDTLGVFITSATNY